MILKIAFVWLAVLALVAVATFVVVARRAAREIAEIRRKRG